MAGSGWSHSIPRGETLHSVFGFDMHTCSPKGNLIDDLDGGASQAWVAEMETVRDHEAEYVFTDRGNLPHPPPRVP
jgi:hypothetical protein